LTLKTDATAAHETGSFSSPPFSNTALTITHSSPSNLLTLTTSATTAQAIGTVSGAPTSTTAPTITVTNSAVSPSNVLTLTTNAAQASASETFTSTPCTNGTNCGPTAGQTLTITNGANPVVVTAVASGGSTTGCGLATNPKTASFTLSTTANTDATRLNTV